MLHLLLALVSYPSWTSLAVSLITLWSSVQINLDPISSSLWSQEWLNLTRSVMTCSPNLLNWAKACLTISWSTKSFATRDGTVASSQRHSLRSQVKLIHLMFGSAVHHRWIRPLSRYLLRCSPRSKKDLWRNISSSENHVDSCSTKSVVYLFCIG